jgi:hypothetical protein
MAWLATSKVNWTSSLDINTYQSTHRDIHDGSLYMKRRRVSQRHDWEVDRFSACGNVLNLFFGLLLFEQIVEGKEEKR